MSFMDKVQILIAGIPASGKSTFAGWLAETKGFIHIDMELPDTELSSLKRMGFEREWDACWRTGDAAGFLKALKGRNSSVALDWGFPANHQVFFVLSRLKAAGVGLWWFDGDRLAARTLFESRGTKPVAAFDSQFAGLSAAWPQISALVGDQIVRTLRPDGRFLKNEEIYSVISGRA
jgi:hypothetical protein